MRNTPRIVGGVTTSCTGIAKELLSTIVDHVITVSTPTTAEMTKLLENTFRSVNIALANEVAIMCRHLDLDVWEVIEAAATKPYGFMPFYRGPGLGGHCIPVDPSYLSWKLRRLNYNARFMSLADDINQHMPEFVLSRATEVLNGYSKSVRGSRILVLGVAYKPDIADLRESPALDVLELLRRRGAQVSYADPYVRGPVELESGPMSAVELSPGWCETRIC
jgi:UDP-N-acetyl-D-glucosamine dehydrogenase